MKRIKDQKKYIKAIDFISELEDACIKNLNVIEISGLNRATDFEADLHSSKYDEKKSAGSNSEIIGMDDALFVSINSNGIIIF